MLFFIESCCSSLSHVVFTTSRYSLVMLLILGQCCSLSHVVVHSVMLLFTQSCCCCSLSHVVIHPVMLLFTQSCCYSLSRVVIHTYVLLFTRSCCCSPSHVVIHPVMLLFTQSCCYSPSRVVVRRGKDTNKNRAEWEHEREVMKREIERLKHELLRLVCLTQ